jgi:acetolactate synthase-1/2/3 large subunit
MMALGAFPENDPLSLGMVGMHGTAAANYAIDKSDLLISAGARFDDRVTGKIDEFASKAITVHIDIDRSAIGKNVETHFGIHGYLKPVLKAVLPRVKPSKHDAWIKQVKAWKNKFPLGYPQPEGVLMPQSVIKMIDRLSQGKAVIATDVGQNQMWATQYFTYTRPRNWISSGGLGTMGFGLPAAIGAQLGRMKELVVCVSGDGGIQMNFQELVVAVEHQLPIVVVILNNGFLGMVRQWQELFYSKRYSGVMLSQSGRRPNEDISEKPTYLPDFVKLAEAHGATACRVTTDAEVEVALKEAFKRQKTTVIECIVSPDANVFPMIPPGQHVSAMIGHTKN